MSAFGGTRRDARERILHLLYESDQRGVDPTTVLADQVLPPDDYTTEVLTGIAEHRVDLDARLAARAEGWTLERMPTMDRLILEIGAYELAHRGDVPTAVILNEAIELANQYSTDDSGRFVNGVLAGISSDVRPAG